jgi:hypothetical protein
MDTAAALTEARLQRLEAELKTTKRIPSQEKSPNNGTASQHQMQQPH